ncbi:glycosyltransferase family 39 protein [Candidatus Woesearchaeota archaeon]|nr:glycosyltransferase family 39 protein [Candidatus Woesearchaeota archaeon]
MDIKKIDKRKIIIGLIFLVILLTGFFLRLYNISDKSIWVDEESSIHFASKTPKNIIKYADKETHPPLYYLILHYWLELFGDSEESVRFLSLLFGVAAIFLIYKVGELLFNKEIGLLSSLILAISAFHIHHSQETRMYSLMVMLALLSIYFFIRVLKEKKIWILVFYLVSSTLLMYSHIYGLFVIAAQNIYFILARKDIKITIKKWAILQAILLAVFIPWIYVLAGQIIGLKTGEFVSLEWLEKPTLLELFETFWVYTYYKLGTLILFLILALGSFLTFNKIKGKHKFNSDLKSNYLLIVWLLTPVILPFLISWIIMPIYSPKYTIAASLAFYLLVARGISKIRSRNLKIIVIAIVIVLSLMCVKYYYDEKSPEPWRDVAGYVDRNAEGGDLVIMIPYYTKESLQRYSEREDIEIVGERDIIYSDPNRVWFVVRYKEFNEDIEGYNLTEKKEYGDLIVYLFEKPG